MDAKIKVKCLHIFAVGNPYLILDGNKVVRYT